MSADLPNDRAPSAETLAISAGYDPASARGAAKPPVYLTSTFVYPSAAAAKDLHVAFFDGVDAGAAPGFIYARLGHPNLDMIEARVAALDGAEDAACFASGMAAITTTLLALLAPGDGILHTRPLYGGTDALIYGELARLGFPAFGILDAVDPAEVDRAVDAALAAGPVGVIWVESPANPTATIADLALIAAAADRIAARQGRRPPIVVDNTFLGPLASNPLRHGADLVMTSLTKYAAGHSDLLAGGISGSAALVRRLKQARTLFGTPLDAHSCWLLLRSLETLALRTARAFANARAIAEYLRGHPKVRSVTWLGFLAEGTPARAAFERQYRGTGSTFSFKIAGGEAEAFRMLDRLKVMRMAVSLGGTETLICHSASTTHYAVPKARREAVGVDDSTLRISVGIEDPADLLADLEQALEAI
ncbi:cystathionine gamma-synthase family protein [Oharaeibacter diazotrophicus]|uniref:Cystathionine gamma-synthase/methionine-gamma-lyase n=1 Tax=Oharaeibacter diazotrophicus TaxID=1920512 RepID=A0A4R6RM50_9HYPH|nr:cystathionine gamma-synthase family protein [Oharaeibacter diazotrophicus]TDP87077.1 cystathionine gamma-synthase/methionine-gamma-lyase [Oharaeibacter diazotrophicus]BBE70980.1 methionine gamma-lyase [Pleomorphomonas sp. SM30]GLS77730.1 methionine gamma-lyase [Oharaeibacter diazotrophicus]